MSLLQPSVIASIDDLELAARQVVEGLRVGINRSPFHGFGAEFQQYRPYRPGDDLKYLDWKLFGRTDRLYTRQFRETTNFAMMIVLDTSASMLYPSGASKLRYAVLVAASLAYLAIEQGNAAGLLTQQDGEFVYLPARSGRMHLRALLAKLDALKGAGKWDGAKTIGRASELLARRGLLFVLSDFYDDEAIVMRELRQVMQRGHDVSMIQVLSAEERRWSFSGQLQLEDVETGEQQAVNAAAAAQEYDAAMEAFLARCRNAAAESRLDYQLFTTDASPDRALREYLLGRSL